MSSAATPIRTFDNNQTFSGWSSPDAATIESWFAGVKGKFVVGTTGATFTPTSLPGSATEGQLYFDATTHLLMAYNGSGWVAVGSGASGAPTDALYVTLSTNASLTVERVLAAGAGITLTDNGAGGTLVIATTAAAPSIARTFMMMGA